MSGPPRPEVLELAARVCAGGRLQALAGDASTRRFHRLLCADGTRHVVMDYGRPFEGETDDVLLGRVFRAAGLRVAEVRECWGAGGCLLLEDLGDTTLEASLGRTEPGRRRAGIERAVRLAADVALRGTPVLARSERATGPTLDARRFRFEMDYFLEHFVGSLRRREAPERLRRELYALADAAAECPRPVLCHRDFHSRNLMVLDGGELAMVDVQDARWGPDSYDLASLLRDAYLDIEESWIEPLTGVYLAALGAAAPAGDFRGRLDLVGAQRMLKALGTFGYQSAVRGRDRYLGAVPRTLERLRRLLPRRAETTRLAVALEEEGLLDPPAGAPGPITGRG